MADVDYGPLACLVGEWRGDQGVDLSPEEDGPEESPFYERLLFEAAGDVTNAEEQKLTIVRYHQQVYRKRNDKLFHNESGYYSWHGETGLVVQSFAIPRGVAVVAEGSAEATDDGCIIRVAADPSGITQSGFMAAKARTLAFTHEITVQGDTLSYTEETMLRIYGADFRHTDKSRLQRQPLPSG